ncbi:MAG: VCBS repeat-containing protein, partial [Myxococcaceae bacterium]|nr:VCBS repeat-containing protein [Myxococcaceae bacterium]
MAVRLQCRAGMRSFVQFAAAVWLGLGCTGPRGADGVSPKVEVTAEPPGDRCAGGGLSVRVEGNPPVWLCHGAAGDPGASASVEVSPEPPGPHCPSGGQKVTTRVGAGPEVASYVCNGASGPALLTVSEPPGPNCAAGGVRITVDGMSRFVCNGVDGASVTAVAEPPGASCPSGGVKLLPSGLLVCGAPGGSLGLDAGPDLDVPETQSLITLSGQTPMASATFRWQQLSGPVVALTGANTLTASFAPPDVQRDTLLVFRLTATQGGITEADDVEVRVDFVNVSPTVTAVGGYTVSAGSLVTLIAEARDPDGQPLTYAWQQVGGTHVTLHGAASAVATFQAPSQRSASTLELEVTVSDGVSAPVTARTVIGVNAANESPEFTAQPHDVTVAAGSPVALSGLARVSDANGNPLYFVMAPGSTLPAGLRLDLMGVLRGLTYRAGRYGPLRLRAVDGLTSTDSAPFFINVLPAAPAELALEAPIASLVAGERGPDIVVRALDGYQNLTDVSGVSVMMTVGPPCTQPPLVRVLSQGRAVFPGVRCPTPGVTTVDLSTQAASGSGTFTLGKSRTVGRRVEIRAPSLSTRLELVEPLNDARRPVVVDLNRDGVLDWVAVSPSTSSVRVVLGGLHELDVPVPNVPVDVAVGDFNGDGRLDLAVTRHGAALLSVLVQAADSSFSSIGGTPLTELSPNNLASGDLDLDGRLDLVTANFGSSSLTVHLNNPAVSTGFRPPLNLPAPGGAYTPVIADLNGDGAPDIASVGVNTPGVMIHLGIPTALGTFQAGQMVALPFGGYVVTAGDIDGDGRTDLAVAHVTVGAVSTLIRTPSGYDAYTFSAPGTLRGLELADLDGDGRTDL